MYDLRDVDKWELWALLLHVFTSQHGIFSSPTFVSLQWIHLAWTAPEITKTHHLLSYRCICLCLHSPERTSPWWWQSSILCVGTCARRWIPGYRYGPPPQSAWCTAFDQSSGMKCLELPLAWRWKFDGKLKQVCSGINLELFKTYQVETFSLFFNKEFLYVLLCLSKKLSGKPTRRAKYYKAGFWLIQPTMWWLTLEYLYYESGSLLAGVNRYGNLCCERLI